MWSNFAGEDFATKTYDGDVPLLEYNRAVPVNEDIQLKLCSVSTWYVDKLSVYPGGTCLPCDTISHLVHIMYLGFNIFQIRERLFDVMQRQNEIIWCP